MLAQSVAARSAYARPEAPQRNPRAIEYDLLARSTARLAQAAAQGAPGLPALLGALDDNQRLWSAFASDVAQPENRLPPALRARLFYLYEFTAHHSQAVRAGKAGVEVLIDINTAVMRGLRGQGEAA